MTRAGHLGILLTAAALLACGAPASPQPAAKLDTVVVGAGPTAPVPAPAMPGVNVPAIKVDTVGYPTSWRKIVVFNVDPTGAKVIDDRGRVAAKIAPDAAVALGTDAASGDEVWQVDLSALAPGRYRVRAGDAESSAFRVGDDVYDTALVAGLKSFYFQRTRTALTKPYAVWDGHAYTRATPSHVHDDVGWDLDDYPEKKRKHKVEAGWHDAGNFDMYVPSTAPSAQALLMAYEEAPDFFTDGQLNIPESGNGVPDLLDEARWGITWVLSMQEKGGGFRHREAVMEWSPEGPANTDRTVRWIAGVSTAATAKAVAMLAVASRVYAPWDRAFAERCATAAKRGWAMLQRTPKRIRPDGKGAKQPLWDDEPGNSDVGARFIAAAEIWRRFRDPAALALARKLFDTEEARTKKLLSGAWANLSRWALMTLALDRGTPADVRRTARQRLLAAAALVRDNVENRDGYRCASGVDDYYWGHNSTLMSKAHLLAVASQLTDDGAWMMRAARDQWHWVLGRNPNGYSMITGVGRGPTRMYHMEWGTREPPPPGFLLGGPNAQNMGFLAPGAPAKALLWDNPKPLRSGVPAGGMWHWRQSDLWQGGFVEDGAWTVGWWAVTEPDILYSANFVLAGAALR